MDKILGRHLENDRDTKRVTDRERVSGATEDNGKNGNM